MTNACYTCPDLVAPRAERPASFDILRGVGLAFSLGVILVLPAALALLAAMQG